MESVSQDSPFIVSFLVLHGFAGKLNVGAQGATKRCTTETRRALRLSRRTEDERFGKLASEPAEGGTAAPRRLECWAFGGAS